MIFDDENINPDDRKMRRVENGCIIGAVVLLVIIVVLIGVWKEFDLLINLMGEPK